MRRRVGTRLASCLKDSDQDDRHGLLIGGWFELMEESAPNTPILSSLTSDV